jgi:hypothetical protein
VLEDATAGAKVLEIMFGREVDEGKATAEDPVSQIPVVKSIYFTE